MADGKPTNWEGCDAVIYFYAKDDSGKIVKKEMKCSENPFGMCPIVAWKKIGKDAFVKSGKCPELNTERPFAGKN